MSDTSGESVRRSIALANKSGPLIGQANRSAALEPMGQGSAIERPAGDRRDPLSRQKPRRRCVCGGLGRHGCSDHGSVFTGSGAGLFKVDGSGRGEVGIPQFHALRLLRCKGRFGSLAGGPAFLLCDRRVNVQHERISLGNVAAHKGGSCRHKPSDECHVSGEAVELGDNDGRLDLPGRCQGRFQLRPPIKGIRSFAGFHLQVFADDGDAVSVAVTGNDVPLGFEAKAAASLLLGGHAQIGDSPRLRCMCVGHVMIVLSVCRVRRRLYVRIGKDKPNRSTRAWDRWRLILAACLCCVCGWLAKADALGAPL